MNSTLKVFATSLIAVFVMSGCGEVSWQRKYVVPIDIHLSESDGAVAVVNIEIPIDLKKQPDTKPNVPLDLSFPLLPKGKGLPSAQGYYSLPDGTGSLIIIWTSKRAASATVQPEEVPVP